MFDLGVTSFSIVDDNGLVFGKEAVCKNALLHLPDEKTQIVKANDKEPGMLLRRFSEKELLRVPDFKSDKLVYSFCVQLDLQGDGSELYPAKPLEIKGDTALQVTSEGHPRGIKYGFTDELMAAVIELRNINM